jgi:hypothetical protein
VDNPFSLPGIDLCRIFVREVLVDDCSVPSLGEGVVFSLHEYPSHHEYELIME